MWDFEQCSLIGCGHDCERQKDGYCALGALPGEVMLDAADGFADNGCAYYKNRKKFDKNR